ncbi:MAG: cupin domain-containing protein [Chloroflexi bacterium]|nr:cupin domain-containing protein [Chloroflexota bacterium]
MNFAALEKKGLAKFLIGENIDPQKLSIHISEVEPGNRSHAAHTHTGVEAFYVFEGQATVEFEGEQFPLDANQAMAIDATRPHGIFNNGATRTRYMVIIAK